MSVHRITMTEIVERQGKRATSRQCFQMEVEGISVLDLVAAIEKIKARRGRVGRNVDDADTNGTGAQS